MMVQGGHDDDYDGSKDGHDDDDDGNDSGVSTPHIRRSPHE